MKGTKRNERGRGGIALGYLSLLVVLSPLRGVWIYYIQNNSRTIMKTTPIFLSTQEVVFVTAQIGKWEDTLTEVERSMQDSAVFKYSWPTHSLTTQPTVDNLYDEGHHITIQWLGMNECNRHETWKKIGEEIHMAIHLAHVHWACVQANFKLIVRKYLT